MSVEQKTKFILWGKAAGRCEICAAPLDEGLYKMKVLVSASGNAIYAPATCTVSVQVRVR